MDIKFGTDGWRAIIAKDYTFDNVARVSEATALYMNGQGMRRVVIGYDCRFEGQAFAEHAASVLAQHGIEVLISDRFASTPMVSLGVVKLEADLGVVITASHNPPAYNGYKLKSKHGGPCIPDEIAAVEALIPSSAPQLSGDFDSYLSSAQIKRVDLEKIYIDHVHDNFDVQAINDSDIHLAFDAMYGAGQRVIPALFPKADLLHCAFNPSFHGQAPEPIHRNLTELSNHIANNTAVNLGLANDGDADRIGMYDEDGTFIDAHHLLLLLLYYQVEFKQRGGEVIVTFSVTNKMHQLAQQYGLPIRTTKIGFKYIAELMRSIDVIVGGEESGGLAVSGHIPERDGIWIGLMVMELIAKSGKSLKQLVQLIHDKVGSFAFDRYDLHIDQALKEAVIAKCQAAAFSSFGRYQVSTTDDLDGFKYYIDDDRWLLIRPSGTEPVLRVYAQAPSHAEAIQMLDAAKATLLA